ncbi:MAG: hypothetical protein AAF198_02940 [Pseudomonadota bacterium]
MKKIVLNLVAAAMVTSSASVALADTYIAEVTKVTPNVIEVMSNGKNYTTMKSNFQFMKVDAKISYSTGFTGKIKSWSAYPFFSGPGGSFGSFEFYKIGETFPSGQRPNSITRLETFDIHAGVVEIKAREACERHENALRNGGQSNKEVHAKTHNLVFNGHLSTKFKVNGAGGNDKTKVTESGGANKLTVRCLKGPKAKFVGGNTGGFQSQVSVEDAILFLKGVSTQSGVCKVRLRLQLSTSHPNMNVNFRYHHSTGSKSKVYSEKSNGTRFLDFTQEFDVPTDQQGWAEGVFHVENAGGAKFKTLPELYKFKCAKGQIGKINNGQTSATKKLKLKLN